MEIKSAEFITSMAEYTDRFPGAGLRQVAICGKSNVGKSSLINRLCRRNKLARTSSTGKPGSSMFFSLTVRSISLTCLATALPRWTSRRSCAGEK